jgi:hypothetical protein
VLRDAVEQFGEDRRSLALVAEERHERCEAPPADGDPTASGEERVVQIPEILLPVGKWDDIVMQPRWRSASKPAAVCPGLRERREAIVLVVIERSPPPVERTGQLAHGKKDDSAQPVNPSQ